MKQWHAPHRSLLVAAMVLAAVVAPMSARAESDGAMEPEGWGNVFAYSLCAGGVAASIVGSPSSLLGVLAYCRQIYRDAVD